MPTTPPIALPLMKKLLPPIYINGQGALPTMKMTFAEFLDCFGEDDDMELIGGVPTQRMAAKLPHEQIQVMLNFLMFGYVTRRGLGWVLGSRTAVQIDPLHGRLPDVLFVRADQTAIIQDRAIYGAPDLVIEIVSENDSNTHRGELESDYRQIGVREIVFIDPQSQIVRSVRRDEAGNYAEETLRQPSDVLRFATISGLSLPLELIFVEPFPPFDELFARIMQPPPDAVQ